MKEQVLITSKNVCGIKSINYKGGKNSYYLKRVERYF